MIKRFENKVGFIDYNYEINDKYPHGIFVFMGSYVELRFRGQHEFSNMVKKIFETLPKGTEVHAAATNKKVVNFLTSLPNFKITTESVEFWKNPENATNIKGFL